MEPERAQYKTFQCTDISVHLSVHLSVPRSVAVLREMAEGWLRVSGPCVNRTYVARGTATHLNHKTIGLNRFIEKAVYKSSFPRLLAISKHFVMCRIVIFKLLNLNIKARQGMPEFLTANR